MEDSGIVTQKIELPDCIRLEPTLNLLEFLKILYCKLDFGKQRAIFATDNTHSNISFYS